MGARAFKGAHNQWLTAEEGHLYGHHELNHKGHFHIEQHDGGAKVSLKTHNGHYVAVNPQHEVYMAHNHHSDEAKFHLEHHGGRVSIKGHHGAYLSVNHEGKVRLHHEHGPEELWEEVSV